MKIVKFASIVLGSSYSSSKHKAYFSNEYNDTSFFGVGSMEEACELSIKLMNDGYQCIELCGAFGEDGARKIIEVTNNKIAIGYSIHLPEQNNLFDELFSS